MLVLLNSQSNNGNALVKWNKAKYELERRYLGKDYALFSDTKNIEEKLNRTYEKGKKIWVAAGGDGTVNLLLNQIMKLPENRRKKICLGSIGLGSSNSFHKPFDRKKIIVGNIPVRLDHENSFLHNVGQIDYKDIQGKWQKIYFIINASIGVMAEANAFFNSKEKIVNFLKPKWLDGANYYSGLITLIGCKNFRVKIIYKNTVLETRLTNLSILINPYFSGDFCYDIKSSPESDFLGFALCENMHILDKLRTFFSLTRQKFIGLPKTKIWQETQVSVVPERPVALETDGEVFLAQEMRFTLLKRALEVCR